jgi:hypothetical protein
MLALLVLAGMLDGLRQADARVAAIAWRLQTANVATCRDVVSLPGFSIETLDQYTAAERAEATAAFALHDLPQVSAVVPDSAAAKAGLAVGDEIAQIDDVALPRVRGGPASYDTTAAAEAAIAASLAHSPAKLTLKFRTINLSGDPGCASQVQLVPGARLDASADGHYVQISGAMYQLADDDAELAFVIAHELAHNLFPEAKRVTGSGKGQRAAELAADRRAIAMIDRAGYDVSKVVPFLQRVSRKRALSWLDESHPAWTPRIAAAAAVAQAPGNRTPVSGR